MDTVAPSNSTDTDASAALPETFNDPGEAWQHLMAARDKAAEGAGEADNPQDLSADDADLESEPATAEHESSGEDDAAPDEDQANGEDEEAAPEAETQPPRDLPRSWTKDRAEHWNKLDPATQDFLLEQDRKASAEVRRVQNETAEARKAAEAERVKWEQATQQRQNLSPLRLHLHNALERYNREFPDIQSWSDTGKLEADPLRAIEWQRQKDTIFGLQAQVENAEKFEATERQGRLATYSKEQEAKLKEMVPEFADAKKFAEAKDRALPMLRDDYGWSDQQLSKWASTDVGHEILMSAGFQKLVADQLSAKDRRTALATAAQKAVSKAVPQVQRPGVKPTTGRNSERVQALTQRFNSSGSLDDAVALHVARRSTRRTA
jgi:hypothetical protein